LSPARSARAVAGRPRQHRIPKEEITTLRRIPRTLARLVLVAALGAGLLVVFASPAFAQSSGAPSLNTVIDNLRTWLVGLLAGVATLFLTVGGLRYLAAGGDPSQVEKAKVALKSAAVGYALAILAPLLVTIIASVVGAG
jgi:hypothetical protein